ncbi:MAG TPA: hypothetical protein PLV13_10685 [Ilumatobacteraceae bacterium]|nr:hypothetical protein [Ilumatobacteraceae bacterium]
MTDSSDRNVVRGGPQPEVKSRPNVALIAALLVIAITLLLFIKNSHHVSIDFVVFDKTTTVRWLILMSIVLGVLIDRAVTIWWRRRKRKKYEAEND